MPCICSHNAIICIPKRRKFRYKNKYYFVEDGAGGRYIMDSNDNEIWIEDFKGRKRSKFYKELTKGVLK